MNRNLPLIIFGVIAILAGVYLLLGSGDGQTQAEGDNGDQDTDAVVAGEEATVRGVVTMVDSEQVPVDGPTLISLERDAGGEAIVAVPSMGINLCDAQENIVGVSTLEEGMTVEAQGTVDSQGYVVPCDSADHYVRIVEGGDTEEVSWERAIEILNSGEVEQVVQLHNLEVTMTLEDGSEVVTTEPAIDDIFAEIEACGAQCSDVVVATE